MATKRRGNTNTLSSFVILSDLLKILNLHSRVGTEGRFVTRQFARPCCFYLTLARKGWPKEVGDRALFAAARKLTGRRLRNRRAISQNQKARAVASAAYSNTDN